MAIHKVINKNPVTLRTVIQNYDVKFSKKRYDTLF